MASKIEKDIDISKWEELKDRLTNIAKKHVAVGVPASKNPRNDGLSNAVIAIVHEFGSPENGIPERSFLRTSMNTNAKKYTSLNAKNLPKVLQGDMTIEQALGQLGSIAAGDVKAYIRDGDFAPLNQETIRRKGSSKPLIDTGAMSQSITYEVRDND